MDVPEAVHAEATLVSREVTNRQIIARVLDELNRGGIQADVDDTASITQLNVDSLEEALHMAASFPVGVVTVRRRHRLMCPRLLFYVN